MSTSTQWQLADDAAERYETVLVPSILGPFAEALVDFVQVRPGEIVVDVGCGTGAASRFAAVRAGPGGRVIGVDINTGMLAAARRRPAPAESAALEWREGDAGRLPVDDASADAALCAQTIQFLPDRARALSELHRILKPRGRMAVSVWAALEDNPYIESLVAAVERHIGPDTAKGLRAAFSLPDIATLRALVEGAGFRDVVADTATLPLVLPPAAEFVPRHVAATPMAGGFAAASEEARQAVVRDVADAMAPFQSAAVASIPFRSHLVMAVRS